MEKCYRSCSTGSCTGRQEILVVLSAPSPTPSNPRIDAIKYDTNTHTVDIIYTVHTKASRVRYLGIPIECDERGWSQARMPGPNGRVGASIGSFPRAPFGPCLSQCAQITTTTEQQLSSSSTTTTTLQTLRLLVHIFASPRPTPISTPVVGTDPLWRFDKDEPGITATIIG